MTKRLSLKKKPEPLVGWLMKLLVESCLSVAYLIVNAFVFKLVQIALQGIRVVVSSL